MMNFILIYLLIFALGALGLVGVAYLVPGGASRLWQANLWLTVLGACLPPLLFILATFRQSEDSALWVALGGMICLGAAVVGYLIGLFLPLNWPLWLNFGLGIATWCLIGLGIWLVTSH